MVCVGIDALRCAKVILGSEAAVAAAVDRSQPYIHTVLKKDDGEVPAEWCIPLAAATAAAGHPIPRAAFRPDIYPEESVAHACRPIKARLAARQREKGDTNHTGARWRALAGR